jgi:L-ribulokinase
LAIENPKSKIQNRYAVGLDFGTESGRAVLVDLADGTLVASAVYHYPDGVIDTRLPTGGPELPSEWALQNPRDWLATVEHTIPQLIAESGIDPAAIVGIGVDFTSCTVLPTTADDTPLCMLGEWASQPHAWPKLWKHHAAQPQADRINEVAQERGEGFIKRYGGKVSSEWLIPKALQILEEAPEVYQAADRIIEGGDWIIWQLCGQEKRNACAAGYKACWNRQEGYPSAAFLGASHPGLAHLADKLGPVYPPGTSAGTLTAQWAERLGLSPETAIGVAIIDAHAGTPGSGVVEPGVMALVMGTSTCHMLMSREEVLVQGISGMVADGIVPGLYGYEAGQASVGDIFAWFVENSVPVSYSEEAEGRGISLHDLLSEKAARQQPGESGLLALDWWNGCRTPLVDADLSGVVLGYTLSTRLEEIYRALIEATAYGTRLVIETFEMQGVPVHRLVAGGGVTANHLLMQIYADVTGREIEVAGAGAASALGAAMLGATAAGGVGGGYDTLAEAARHMVPDPLQVYRPESPSQATYDLLYREYSKLVDLFGRDQGSVLKTLHHLRTEARQATVQSGVGA